MNNPDLRTDVFMDHTSHFTTFDDGTSPPPPGFAKVTKPLSVIIETHLFIEARLIRLIERNLPHPTEVQLSRYGFDKLTRLALGLGAVPIDEKPSLLELNRLRNKFAHDINWRPTSDAIIALYEVLTPEQRSIAKDVPIPTELDRLIVYVACLMSAHFAR